MTALRGRRPEAETREIRARVETLMFGGLRSPGIHRALTGADNPNPVAISERGVRNHMTAVRTAWLERDREITLEQARADALAGLEDMKRVALQRSALAARTTVGVGYLNIALKATEQHARIAGLAAPVRTELTGRNGGPIAVHTASEDWGAALDPLEEARRLRLHAATLEERANAGDETAPST